MQLISGMRCICLHRSNKSGDLLHELCKQTIDLLTC